MVGVHDRVLRFIYMEQNEEREWLNIQECVAFGQSLGFYRTPKTYRKWAHTAHQLGEEAGDITVRTQDTENNFRYLIERHSLEIKIKQELEFERQNKVRTGSHASAPNEPALGGGEVSTEAPPAEEVDKPDAPADEELNRLREENAELKLDNTVKTRLLVQAGKERKEFIDRLEQRSHKIGVLETQLLALGAPVEEEHNPQNDESSPHEGSGDGALQ